MKKDNYTQYADKGSCVGLISSALPEVKNKILAASSDTGVSTHCIPAETKSIAKNPNEQQNWYALRTTYGREKKAYDYLVAKGVSAFYPTIQVMKENKRTTEGCNGIPTAQHLFCFRYRRGNQKLCV